MAFFRNCRKHGCLWIRFGSIGAYRSVLGPKPNLVLIDPFGVQSPGSTRGGASKIHTLFGGPRPLFLFPVKLAGPGGPAPTLRGERLEETTLSDLCGRLHTRVPTWSPWARHLSRILSMDQRELCFNQMSREIWPQGCDMAAGHGTLANNASRGAWEGPHHQYVSRESAIRVDTCRGTTLTARLRSGHGESMVVGWARRLNPRQQPIKLMIVIRQ